MNDDQIGIVVPVTSAPPPPDVIDALVGLWRARWLLLVTCLIGAALALVGVVRAPVMYTVGLTLTPSEASPSEAASRLGSLASLAGISGGSHQGTPFDLFLLATQSRDVARVVATDDTMLRHLFEDRWDAGKHRWRSGVETAGGFSFRRLLGLPVAPLGRPTAGEVNDVLNARLDIAQNTERGTATLLFDDTDPAFGVRFLARITAAADAIVKERSLTRSKEYVTYLKDRAGRATLAEDRQILAAELGARERSLMLASSALPYAADPVGEPTASTRPTSPKVGLSLAIGVAAGFAAGLLVLLLLQVRRRTRS